MCFKFLVCHCCSSRTSYDDYFFSDSIAETCKVNSDCKISRSVCNEERCVCLPGYVKDGLGCTVTCNNDLTCLIDQLISVTFVLVYINENCTANADCKGANTSCAAGKCVCGGNVIRDGNRCVAPGNILQCCNAN